MSLCICSFRTTISTSEPFIYISFDQNHTPTSTLLLTTNTVLQRIFFFHTSVRRKKNIYKKNAAFLFTLDKQLDLSIFDVLKFKRKKKKGISQILHSPFWTQTMCFILRLEITDFQASHMVFLHP